ncbi:recombinase RecA [Chryseobacterium potabilaquae]|uniref:Protein RecA n=1 Tax=Chryseobacterium potabilaquae TaxID=2675057 RepID=A0A6N4XAV0_9FLAO|nr:recombinase RecA [Chryseobacterium potabilaquae]CAA7196852.1 Protein RecA [Chryseobacterium potabilaquae]
MKQSLKNKENKNYIKSNETFINKNKSLNVVLAKLDHDFGKGTVMRMGDVQIEENIEVISSGSAGLDLVLGVGGYPKGRIIEIYGPESSGKTTLALHAIAEAQKAGGFAAFIDAEHAFDRGYAEKLGIDLGNLIVSQPDNGEQALEITDNLIRSGVIDIVVIDSVAALTPKAEIEGEMGDSKIGLHAKLMSQALRKLTSVTSRTKCAVIFINQLRDRIGEYDNSEITTGGNALKFFASIRVDIRRAGGDSSKLKDGNNNVIGSRARVKVIKNKVAPPFKQVEFDIMYGQGISKEGEVLDIAVNHGIIAKNGSWFSYGDENLGQGRDSARSLIKGNPVLLAELIDKIEMLKLKKFTING